ncbi:MAG: hypothetical protein COX70_00720 [Flavobacteriales bacterium CG_4_10_14_0_2_um_filter_32_8]|nr:MAG: hypothetical protein COX70_00720 [Flavobacteriales bacterium CG_4_10_14_0_2_um_filter_32_8]PJB15816.1 MAG: hypothetical protein CO118_02050 [Flavobacteriales bacterium CG_4_9_14_3_um_filter_32_8]
MKSITQLSPPSREDFFTSPLEGRMRGVITIFFLFITIFSFAQKSSQIEILNANTLEYEDMKGIKVKRLIGDVQLKHDNALMFCDTALIYSNSNTMDAFGHVRMVQGDSLQLFGDSLKYNGNTKIAILRGAIRLINNDVTLTTNYLDYNRNDNVAYYYGGGTMINQKENNTLTSEQGYYYSNGEAFYFKKDVVLVNPEYRIEADTLNYNSASEIVNFLGPTTITSKDNFIYTENGWYNTVTNKSKFYKNAYLFSEKKRIEGDTLYYDRNAGFGKLICNGIITDTVENIIIKGDVAHLFEQKDSAMITQEAMMMQITDKDTLYMHADTFIVSTQYVMMDSMINKNITPTNTKDTVRTLFAYHHAKIFSKDMQGKADTVIYNFSDSTINLYQSPIIWSKENQITADFIHLLMVEGEIDKMYMDNNAFIISKVDSITENFNQIKGKNMIGYFQKRELHKIDVKQNSETIYFALDDAGKYIGVNKMNGENMLIFLKENELQTISFLKSPQGELNPIKEVSPKDLLLKGFNWRITERPTNMFDIFSH